MKCVKKNFKKKLKITKHFKKKHEHFLNPSERYNMFWYILLNQKVYLFASFPSSPTYSVKIQGPQPFRLQILQVLAR